MPMLRIGKPNGEVFEVYASGMIRRLDIKGFQPSGAWRMIGLESVDSPREYIALADIPAWLARGYPLTFRSGNPRYTVRDYDHGSTRVWGNSEHHGVKWIQVLQPKESA